MLDFLKKIFQKETEPEKEEVPLATLTDWFKDKVSRLDYNQHFQKYFQQIKELKQQLKEKVKVLQDANISEKDHKGVEDRVRNIVKGHRDNYVREIERFVRDLTILDKDKFSTLEDYQQVLEFNQELDKEIENLAKRTAKSYQAAQHLFFEPVEDVFKVMGKLNLLVKDFSKNIEEKTVEKIKQVQQLILQLNQNIEKKENLKKEIKEKEENLAKKEEELKEKQTELEKLKEARKYKDYLKLKEEKNKTNQDIKEVNDRVHSFFSRLNKPLRKYERIAMNNKLIQEYLKDSIKAFSKDSGLEINDVIGGLKKALEENSLQFDEKQKNKFLELVKKNEEGYLQELFNRGKELDEESAKIKARIEENKISIELEEREKSIDKNKDETQQIRTNISELKAKLGKTNLEKIKEEIITDVEETIKIRPTIA